MFFQALYFPLDHKVMRLWSSVWILIWCSFNFGLTLQSDVLFLQDLTSYKAICICKEWGGMQAASVWLNLSLPSGLPTGGVPSEGGGGRGSAPAGLALPTPQGNRPYLVPFWNTPSLQQVREAEKEGENRNTKSTDTCETPVFVFKIFPYVKVPVLFPHHHPPNKPLC